MKEKDSSSGVYDGMALIADPIYRYACHILWNANKHETRIEYLLIKGDCKSLCRKGKLRNLAARKNMGCGSSERKLIPTDGKKDAGFVG